MPLGGRPAAPTTTAAVGVRISRDPALVRTVRLVAAAVARRAAGDEDFVEEVRLAVGEACALLLGPAVAPDEGSIEVTMRLHEGLHVSVVGRGVDDSGVAADVDGVEPWAVLTGLIEHVAVEQAGDETRIEMSWPSALTS